MAFSMDNAFVNEFMGTLTILNQEYGSEILNADAVDTAHQQGEYQFHDQLEKDDELTESPARNAATAHQDAVFARRRVGLTMYTSSVYVANFDKARMLVNPSSKIAQNISYKFGRKKTSVILTAADANAYTDKDGGTLVSFTGTTISGAGSTWSGDTTTMNIDKILGCRSALNAANAPRAKRFIVANPVQSDYLLLLDKMTSADYNSVRALVTGEVDSFLGFKYVWTTEADEEVAFAWHRDAMLFVYGTDAVGEKAKIEEDMTHNYEVQVYNEMYIGSTRMVEDEVVKVLCPIS